MTPEEVLIAHQRHGIGSCACGWGVHAGNVGQSHAAHVVSELRKHYDMTPRKGLRSTEATNVRRLGDGSYRVAGQGSRSVVTGKFRRLRGPA